MEFSAWQQHLHAGGYTLSDVEEALFQYCNSEQGRYKPKFSDLKSLLSGHKKKRLGKRERTEPVSYEVTDAGLAAIEKIKATLKDRVPLTDEESEELYNQLTNWRRQ